MAIVAASNTTHFLLNGAKYPRVYKVFPHGSLDARLEDVDGSGTIVVETGSTVGGVVQTTQAGLVDALAAIVSSASAGGGSGLTDGELRATPVPVSLSSGPGVILSLTTSGTGASYVAFGSQSCTMLDIVNDTGTDLEYRRGGAGNTIKIQNGTGREVYGLTNANEISVRRVDQSNTQVTVKAEALA